MKITGPTEYSNISTDTARSRTGSAPDGRFYVMLPRFSSAKKDGAPNELRDETRDPATRLPTSKTCRYGAARAEGDKAPLQTDGRRASTTDPNYMGARALRPKRPAISAAHRRASCLGSYRTACISAESTWTALRRGLRSPGRRGRPKTLCRFDSAAERSLSGRGAHIFFTLAETDARRLSERRLDRDGRPRIQHRQSHRNRALHRQQISSP